MYVQQAAHQSAAMYVVHTLKMCLCTSKFLNNFNRLQQVQSQVHHKYKRAVLVNEYK